ncbi:hypothetical protein [Clostridium sp. C8-1-8]|uniref:hypothetical protein n=1 Tax=Clostridium sp. C8-1-8 TaxID=2698831 RepID=UPI00136B91E5|nr:hypothetical protein [Clostridium sp. C8-1-8]
MGKVIQFKQAKKDHDDEELLEEYYALQDQIKGLEYEIAATEEYIEKYKDRHTNMEYKIYKLAIANTIQILVKKKERAEHLAQII